MSISFCCPKCETSFHVSDEHAGKRAKCKKCGAPLRIPSLAAQAEAPPVPEHRASGADAHDRETSKAEVPHQTPESVPPPPASLRSGPAQRSTRPLPPSARPSQPAVNSTGVVAAGRVGERACPFCAETIEAAAVSCARCGALLDGAEAAKPTRWDQLVRVLRPHLENTRTRIAVGVVAGFIVVLGVMTMLTGRGGATGADRTLARKLVGTWQASGSSYTRIMKLRRNGSLEFTGQGRVALQHGHTLVVDVPTLRGRWRVADSALVIAFPDSTWLPSGVDASAVRTRIRSVDGSRLTFGYGPWPTISGLTYSRIE